MRGGITNITYKITLIILTNHWEVFSMKSGETEVPNKAPRTRRLFALNQFGTHNLSPENVEIVEVNNAPSNHGSGRLKSENRSEPKRAIDKVKNT